KITAHRPPQCRKMCSIVQACAKIVCDGTYVGALRALDAKMHFGQLNFFNIKRMYDHRSGFELDLLASTIKLISTVSIHLYHEVSRRNLLLCGNKRFSC